MTKKMIEQTKKDRILQVAAAEFASKGFDGARVDKIASQAGVNKALIYYYYKSKEELLSLLFTDLKDKVMALFDRLIREKIDYKKPSEFRRMMIAFMDLLEERQDVIRVMMMETAKRTPVNTLIFSILADILNALHSLAEEEQVAYGKNESAFMITEFFTGIMPVLNYVVYHEIWMERFNIEESELRENFLDSFMGTHFNFTLDKLNGTEQ